MKLIIPLAFALSAAAFVGQAKAATSNTAADGKSAGSCGTYMYHKDGKCMDARNPEKPAWHPW